MMKQIRADTGICHLRVPADMTLRELVVGADLSPLPVQITAKLFEEWLYYGSIYLEGKRLRADQPLKADQIVRVHTRRKTYVTKIPSLRERLVFENEDFLVLDKPSGLPTHATLDNYIENACYLLSQELGSPLYVTHRLDVATHGLLILAKSSKAQAAINKQFSKRQVEKIYRAKVPRVPPPGLVVHWMNPESRVPKETSATEVPGWWECRLEILNNENPVLIRLLTGKTHQIRAQLRALGAPIDGDAVYGSVVKACDGQIDLECFEMKMRWLQKDLIFTRKVGQT